MLFNENAPAGPPEKAVRTAAEDPCLRRERKEDVMKQSSCRMALKLTLPVLAGYVFLGFAFGLLVRDQGFAWWYAPLMSLCIYSGALEFAAVPLLTAPFDPLGSFILGFMLSARHLFYGIPMLGKYRGQGVKKPFLIFGLTDETFSILSTIEPPDKENAGKFYLFVTLFDCLYWNLGTLLGSLFGGILPFKLEGLDFALTALFIVLFLEQLKSPMGRRGGFLGFVVTALVLAFFGSGKLVILSMLGILLLLLLGRRRLDRAE